MDSTRRVALDKAADVLQELRLDVIRYRSCGREPGANNGFTQWCAFREGRRVLVLARLADPHNCPKSPVIHPSQNGPLTFTRCAHTSSLRRDVCGELLDCELSLSLGLYQLRGIRLELVAPAALDEATTK